MIPLTTKARAATFPLDQLLAAKRRGTRVCLLCGSDDTPAHKPTCDSCLRGMLYDPDDLIVMNHGRNPR